jgi:hypothetical protein
VKLAVRAQRGRSIYFRSGRFAKYTDNGSLP